MQTIPPTADRVAMNTDGRSNRRIRRNMIKNTAVYSGKEREAIAARLAELNREWDTERTLETSASLLTVLGIVLGFTKSRWWFLLSGMVGVFLLTHAIKGWCPPLTVIRKLGVRTAKEIEEEKNILRQLRGDFRDGYIRRSPRRAEKLV